MKNIHTLIRHPYPPIHPAHRQHIFQHHNFHRGFTLVEIMVAMTIGLLMMAGILQISQANRESSRLQSNMGFVQENIRIAMELLGRDIRKAGYYEDNDPDNRIFGPIAAFVTATTTDGGGANNDEITLRYESDKDCLDQAIPLPPPAAADGNRYAINHYYISNDQRLMCRGNGGDARSLVENVENMQILYGENTDGDSRSANRYVNADIANMANVVSVRIALRFVSRDAVRQTADSKQYALLDATVFTPGANDRHLRREITTTIFLRNSLR